MLLEMTARNARDFLMDHAWHSEDGFVFHEPGVADLRNAYRSESPALPYTFDAEMLEKVAREMRGKEFNYDEMTGFYTLSEEGKVQYCKEWGIEND